MLNFFNEAVLPQNPRRRARHTGRALYASSGEGSPAYLPWVKQSAEHGSYPRSPDQVLVFHRRPDKGRLRSVTRKPYQVAGEASRQKAKTLDPRFNMNGVNGERVSSQRVGMFNADRNCRITHLANPTYWLSRNRKALRRCQRRRSFAYFRRSWFTTSKISAS